MKAFLIGFFVLALTVISTAPTWAKINDYQTSNTQSVTIPSAVKPSQPVSPSATASGSVRLLPAGDGTYQIVATDPNSSAPYQITQAQNPCDLPGVGGVCDVVSGGFDKIGDLAGDVWGGVKCATSPSCWIKKSVSLVQNALVKQLAGCEAQDEDCWREQYTSVMNPNEPVKNAGAVMVLANLTGNVASMQLPISTDLYLANINPFRQANAQGFNDLREANVIFDIWKKARDAAYALSIIILVIVGFLIMLRTKLDSKTAINVTNALPRIVIMLLLITFSFAISGLIIDLGRVAVQFGLYLIPDVISANTLGRLFLNTMYLVTIPIFLFVTGLSGVVCGNACAAGGTAAFLLGGGVFVFAAAAVAALALFLIMLILVLILILYLLFIMITRYAKFIVSTMISPLIMLAYPLPHGSTYIMDFYKRQIGYIMTIPIIIFLVEVSFAIAGSCIPSPFGGGLSGRLDGAIGGALSPCAGSTTIPGTDFNPFGLFSAIAPLVGLGVLFMSTKAGDIADGLLHIKPLTHGGGGHGGGLFGILALPGEGLEKVADASKAYYNIKTPASNMINSMMMRGQMPKMPAGAERLQLSASAGGLLKGFTGNTPIPTAANFNGRPAEKAAFDSSFTNIKDQFRFDPAEVDSMVTRGDYLPLVNDLRDQIGLMPKTQDGKLAEFTDASRRAVREASAPRGSGIARAPGRVFGINEESVASKRAELENKHIDRSIINQINVASGRRQTTPPRVSPTFEGPVSGSNSGEANAPEE